MINRSRDTMLSNNIVLLKWITVLILSFWDHKLPDLHIEGRHLHIQLILLVYVPNDVLLYLDLSNVGKISFSSNIYCMLLFLFN